MSFVSIAPDLVAQAASELTSVGSAVTSANASAAAATTNVLAAAGDEISAAIAALFSDSGQLFQFLGKQATNFHAEFVKVLDGTAASYLSTEVANAQHALLGTGQPIANAAADLVYSGIPITTPLGEFMATFTYHLPDGGSDGPFGATLELSTPLGPVLWSNTGIMSGSESTSQVTGGQLIVPPAVRWAAALAGPLVTGGNSLMGSYTMFSNAVLRGDLLGATGAFVSAPFLYSDAVLFGHHNVTLSPSDLLGAVGGSFLGSTAEINVPFGGLFASPQHVTATWPYSADTGGGMERLASSYAYQGSQFGGLVPELLEATGGAGLLRAIGVLR